MRIARPVGLSQDGKSLLVATSTGEELSIPVDDRLHAALRGDQPRLGQLEIEMDNALTPRDIQSRIRAGESLESVGRVAGLPLDRVERFAAPVLAEREHIALVAMSSSVRRRGETSGHRLLRLAVTERLAQRGINIDTVDWDAYRLDDGRWSVSASYASGESSRQAVFLFDQRARYSVAENDEARWVLGEHSSAKGPQPGRRRPAGAEGDADFEPTLDLSDELALVRAIQPDVDLPDDEGADDERADDERAEPAGPAAEQASGQDEEETGHRGDGPEPVSDGPSTARSVPPVRGLHAVPDAVEEPDPDERQPGVSDRGTERDLDRDPDGDGDGDTDDEESPLEMLTRLMDRGDADNAEAYGATGHGRLSDASAVPDIDNSGWEPAIVVDYPVEPAEDEEPLDEAETTGRDSAQEEPGARDAAASSPRSHAAVGQEGPDPSRPRPQDRPDPKTDEADAADAADAEPGPQPAPESGPSAEPAPEAGPTTNRPAGRRKRASVPSWDEIMFGGPPRSR